MNSIDNPMFEPAESKWAVHQGETTGPEYRRSSNSTWVFVLALAVALVGLAGFGYFALKKANIQITQLFGNQAVLNTLGQRVDTAEGKLRDLTGGWESVTQRLTALEGFQGKVSRDFLQTRKYAENLTERLHQQVSAEIEARTSVLDARLRQVESDEAAQRSQLARVEGELRQEITSTRDETGRDLSGVHQQVESNAHNLDSLSRRLDRERVDFEVAKGRTTELVPGVSLQISGTNNRYQRFRGSLWLLQDRRTLWLHDESVHQPVRFYHKEGGEPYELIVTDVTKQHSVIGYLLVPKGQQAAVNPLSDNDEARTSTSGND
jgi:hypothetical protein